MKKRSIVLSWIGFADIQCAVSDLADEKRKKLLKIAGIKSYSRTTCGPIKTFLDNITCQDIYLLSNYPPEINDLLREKLTPKPHIIPVDIDNPTDYTAIFIVVDKALASITQKHQAELSILLSPGTPAMTAIWVLLGKSKYPATFYQTHNGKAWVTDIPFDLTVDFLPKLIKKVDTAWSHLANKLPIELYGFSQIIGKSPAIRETAGRAAKAAQRNVSVLLLGESGTGKEVFARAIHAASPRADKPFIAINCAAIPADLLESELFGHTKGAFTGADSKKDGAFKLADQGTIFLDEIGECPPLLQAKLLRALQPPPGASSSIREFQPVGSSDIIKSDVRIVAATNRRLAREVELGNFREDLFYRLAVITIKLPPLRDRGSDAVDIAYALLDQINKDFASQDPGYENKKICDSTKIFVKKYPWPGNVRELHNALLQASVMADTEQITGSDLEACIADIPGRLTSDDPYAKPLGSGFSIDNLIDSLHIHYLIRARDEAHGSKAEATRLLGLDKYQTLDYRIKKYKINWEEKK